MMWLALLVAVLLWWLMTGLALMSVHQSLRNQRIIFALATVFVLRQWRVKRGIRFDTD